MHSAVMKAQAHSRRGPARVAKTGCVFFIEKCYIAFARLSQRAEQMCGERIVKNVILSRLRKLPEKST